MPKAEGPPRDSRGGESGRLISCMSVVGQKMKLMKSLRPQALGSRLGLVFAALIGLAILVEVIGITRLGLVTESLTLIGSDRVPKVEKLANVSDDLNLIARELRNTLIFSDATAINASLATCKQADGRIAKAFEDIQPTIRSEGGKQRLAAAERARAIYEPIQNQFIDLIQAGKSGPARTLLTEQLRPAQLAYMGTLSDFRAYQIELISRAADEGQRHYAQAKLLMLGLLCCMIVAGLGLGLWVTRSITRPIHYAVQVAEKVAAGDLSSHIESHTLDETGRLLRALGAMNHNLAQIVSEVRHNSDCIASGTAQIACGNADLRQRTEAQACALQQTASATHDIGSTVRTNAESATQANLLARNASAVANEGGEVVGKVVTTMLGISDSSRKIGDIIGVIDGIAFQTNILALNAAVEAARAGEQGRGFAVVASEVRSLAQRSAEAAKEIKALIHSSLEQVDHGTVLVDQAGKTMSQIVDSIQRVDAIVAEITSASAQQNIGIQQVGEAVTQMDQVTKLNATLVEESVTAAQNLKAKAEQLVHSVAVFKLGNDSWGAGAQRRLG